MTNNLPVNWEYVNLDKLLDIQSGFAFESEKFSKDKGTQLIRIRDLKNGFSTKVLFNGEFNKDYLVNSGEY
ncbi:restriction endonuclease subunit S, partial [Arcobacter sp. HD9-500m-PIT-SAG02]